MTKQLRRLMVGALALAAVTACDDGIDPIATGTVQIQAFVDADNSNDFDATADDPISGATVTLTAVGDDTNTLTATTAADGVATFSNVEVGAYTASIELPAALTGVTLASASTPTVTVEEDASGSASFRYTYVPGSITGHAFVGEGAWVDGAPVVPGLAVSLMQGGAEAATTETDAAGAFTFNGLLPGDFTVEVEVPAFLSTTTDSRSVTVGADAASAADFGFDIVVTNTITEARAATAGDMMSVVGTAISGTTGEGSISGSTFNIQNDAGITIFQGSLGVDVEMGDSVLVYGDRGAFRNDIQIGADNLIVLGAGTLPTPQTTTVSELNAGEYQGELAKVEFVVVDSVGYSSGSGSEMWVSDATTGEDFLLYVDTDAGIDLATTLLPGEAYHVTGVVVKFDDLIELKPRFTADIEEATLTGTTVADVRAATVGTAVEVTGVVTEAGNLEGNGFYMEDATAGIFVYMGFGNVPATLDIGDVVTVTGDRAQFNSIAQIGGTVTVTETGATTTPMPSAIGTAQLNSGDFQGRLVVLNDVVVSSVAGSNVFVKASAEATDSALVRIDSDSGVSAGSFVVGDLYTIAGVVTNFGGTEQVKPRFPEDVEGIVVVEPTVMTVTEARAAALGTLVEVSGVVTVDSTHFGGTNYIQDSEAGISIYWAGANVAGDQVTVIGELAEYQGNLQIAVDSIATTGTAAVPAPVVVTGAQVAAGENPGEVVTVEAFTVTTIEVLSYDNHIVTGTDAAGDTVMVYVDSRNGMASSDWTVGTEYSVTGIMGHRTAGWFVWPRKPADVTAN